MRPDGLRPVRPGARDFDQTYRIHREVRLGDLRNPGAQRATRRIESCGFLADGEKDCLRNLLGSGPIERPGRQRENQRGLQAVDGPERLSPTSGELAH